MELQIQGKMPEALAEVTKAAELDPLDPANHFTLGSVKGGIGAKRGDAALVEKGLEECWLAAKLDPNWLLPWTEIGWILLRAGRGKEAVEHLRSVSPERGPPRFILLSSNGGSIASNGKFCGIHRGLRVRFEVESRRPTSGSGYCGHRIAGR